MKCASTFSRPRCGMPMTTSSRPSSLPRRRISSSAGTVDSAAVQAEALGAGVFLVEKALEGFGVRQLLQDRPLLIRREVGPVAAGLDALLDPGLLGGILDVHELDADLTAIGGAHGADDFVAAVAVS